MGQVSLHNHGPPEESKGVRICRCLKANPRSLHFHHVAERPVIYHLMNPFQNPMDDPRDFFRNYKHACRDVLRQKSFVLNSQGPRIITSDGQSRSTIVAVRAMENGYGVDEIPINLGNNEYFLVHSQYQENVIRALRNGRMCPPSSRTN